MITRASARKGFSLLELIVVLVVLGLLAAIAIPTYQALIGKTQEKTAIATAESVARNGIALAAFDREGVVSTGPAALVGSHLTDAAGEVEGDDIAPALPGAQPTGIPAGKVCVNFTAIGAEDEAAHVVFDTGLNASFFARAGTCPAAYVAP